MLNSVLIVYTRRKGKQGSMGERPVTVQARALRRAADILGGKDALRVRLHVPMRSLEQWLQDTATPPMDVFLKAVDIISGPARGAPPTASMMRRALTLTRQTGDLIRASDRAIERARNAPRPSPSVTRFLKAAFGQHERVAMLDAALSAALEAAGTDMGNVQLKLEDGLHIVAQRGFKDPFLQFFDCVRHTDCACGSALKAGRRIVVRDVAADPIFAGTEAGRVMQEAGLRAVQSTPLIATSGVVLGMLSTHYSEPRAPAEDDLQEIDLVAHRAALWLELATA